MVQSIKGPELNEDGWDDLRTNMKAFSHLDNIVSRRPEPSVLFLQLFEVARCTHPWSHIFAVDSGRR